MFVAAVILEPEGAVVLDFLAALAGSHFGGNSTSTIQYGSINYMCNYIIKGNLQS
jgi:hypothetical protein